MKKNKRKSINADEWLAKKYGAEGTPETDLFREEAQKYYYESIRKKQAKKSI